MGKYRQLFHGCKHLFQISLLSSYAAIALHTGSSYAQPTIARLEDWRFDPETLQLEIFLSAASQPRQFYLSQPPRIVVDLPDTKLGKVSTQQNYYGSIQSIRVSQLNAEVTRIVLDLAPGTFIDPTTVRLQPISQQDTTRWVLRPAISNNTYVPPGNLPPSPGNFSPTTISPSFPENLPTGIYPPQPSGNLPTGIYPPQPSGNLPPGIYPPQPSGNLPPGIYPPQPSGNLPTGIYPPQPPSNFPSNRYVAPPSFNMPPAFTNLPPTNNYSPQQPLIQVPPLAPNNSSQAPSSTLPPAFFPNQGNNHNNSAPSKTPNFPAPSLPNYPSDVPVPEVIDFGQPFPKTHK